MAKCKNDNPDRVRDCRGNLKLAPEFKARFGKKAKKNKK